MSALLLQLLDGATLFGCKGPQAAPWLSAQGIAIPSAPNTWQSVAGDLLVARLGSNEFFIDETARAGTVARITAALAARPQGVYPVMREDWTLQLGGDGAEDLLAQVCNVQFAALELAARPVIMTLMIGVAVLIVALPALGGSIYRIWVDPTYGPYLCTSLQGVVAESGGIYRGSTA